MGRPPFISPWPDSIMPPPPSKRPNPQGHHTMASSPFLRPLPTFLLFILLVLLLDLFSSTTAFFLPCPSSSQLQQQQKQCGGITRRGSGRPAAVIKLRATARDDKGKEEEITGLEGTNEGMVSRRHRRTPALEEQREMRASR